MTLVVFALALLLNSCISHKLFEEFSWNYLNYTFESPEQYRKAVENGAYDPTKNIPFDIDFDEAGNRYFVSVEREEGVPASLTTIDSTFSTESNGYLLRPYPSWELTDMYNCDSIVNVYRTTIDVCHRLWVLDTGYHKITYHCPPKILQFDLKTDTLVQTITIPQEYFPDESYASGIVTNIAVHTNRRNCKDYTMYVTESLGGELFVYENDSWRSFKTKEMTFNPDYINVTVGGESLDFPFGIVNIALSSVDERVYFSSLTSLDISSAKTCALYRNDNAEYTDYQNAITSQATSFSSSYTGILFIGESHENSLICMPIRDKLYPDEQKTLAESEEELRFIISQKVTILTGGFEKLYLLSNRFSEYVHGKLNFNEPNYRVFTADVKDLVKGTKCEDEIGHLV